MKFVWDRNCYFLNGGTNVIIAQEETGLYLFRRVQGENIHGEQDGF